VWAVFAALPPLVNRLKASVFVFRVKRRDNAERTKLLLYVRWYFTFY
jgi:hypothetical protein